MKLCDIIGRVWTESPIASLGPSALVLVRDVHDESVFIALDLANAGTGTRVLVVTGQPAQNVAKGAPVDAVVLGLVSADEREASQRSP